MDFEEWYDNRIWGNEDFKEACWAAWEDATKAEREACAKVCEAAQPPLEHFDVMRAAGNTARKCAKSIRMRSNACGEPGHD